MIDTNTPLVEIWDAFKRVTCMMYGKMHRYRAIMGKCERANLRGQEFVYHTVKVGEQPVLIKINSRTHAWAPYIIIDSEDIDNVVIISTCLFSGKWNLCFMRGHAVKRYVQRMVMHDENYKVSREEFDRYMQHILAKLNIGSMCWDDVMQGRLTNFEGGAFVCHIVSEADVVFMNTYILVSMMRPNQSIANGRSMRSKKELERDFDINLGVNSFKKICERIMQ